MLCLQNWPITGAFRLTSKDEKDMKLVQINYFTRKLRIYLIIYVYSAPTYSNSYKYQGEEYEMLNVPTFKCPKPLSKWADNLKKKSV